MWGNLGLYILPGLWARGLVIEEIGAASGGRMAPPFTLPSGRSELLGWTWTWTPEGTALSDGA